VVYGVLYRGVCVGTGGMCSPGCGWGRVVEVGARGERLLGVGVVCMLCTRFCMDCGRLVW
jgi:hypothetical protein